MHCTTKKYVGLKLSSNGVLSWVLSQKIYRNKKQYSPHINPWFTFCTRHNADPFDSHENQGAEFLAEHFHQGMESRGMFSRDNLCHVTLWPMMW